VLGEAVQDTSSPSGFTGDTVRSLGGSGGTIGVVVVGAVVVVVVVTVVATVVVGTLGVYIRVDDSEVIVEEDMDVLLASRNSAAIETAFSNPSEVKIISVLCDSFAVEVVLSNLSVLCNSSAVEVLFSESSVIVDAFKITANITTTCTEKKHQRQIMMLIFNSDFT
jgi:hypothetical protein